ncbi:MAG: hypothetical protein A3F68_07290 [Acidobacteria bacterium RIFCSPLOWO2_12_FULL_54_10]|nr:MAG: hypothetical protein A3F68_07290 [Acidobacteria bacterium RIFCSPLOWO2_12_FULL_54_10]
MRKSAHQRWNTMATVVTLAMVIGLGARMVANWQSDAAFAQEQPAAEEHTAPAPQAEGAPAEQAAAAQHEEAAAGEHAGEEHGLLDEIFHWFNFLLIVAGIWFFSKKMVGPFLNERAKAIREEMDCSARALELATQKLATVEDKLTNLERELQQLRNSSQTEAKAESARIEEASKADAEKIVRTAEQEIAAAAKAARRELKVYTAELAVSLAEKGIQSSINAQSDQQIFQFFVKTLGNESSSSDQPASKGGV